MKMSKLKILFFSILVTFFISCQSNKNNLTPNLEGDLYYTWLKLGSFYGRDSLFNNYKNFRDTLEISELMDGNPKGIARLEALEKHNLLNSPYIYLKDDLDSVMIVYMSKEDFKPITQFTHKELINDNKKVRIKLNVEHLTDELYLCKKLVSVKLIKGETSQSGRKMKKEDYR